MRYAITCLGAAAMVAAAPASSSSQAMDFNAILTAVGPSLTGAPNGGFTTAQTDVYDQASATSAAAAAVTGVATAQATASVAARSLDDDDLQKRGFCIFGFCFGGSSSTTTTSSGSTATKTTATTATSTNVVAAVTSGVGSIVAQVTSLASVVVPSTCTPVSWTNTFEFITTDTACAQPYEVGTYCGFINPEDPCAPQPVGLGVISQVIPDTPAAFLAYAPYQSAALAAPVPSGYANTFKNYNASVNANSYMGMHTLPSYDVAGCAKWCDNTTLCTAFNIFVERDPAWNPDQCSCQQPSSINNFVCTLWGSGVEPAAAVNAGGWRNAFNVVIAASNGYEKTNNTTPVTPPGWTNPQNCSSNVHSHGSTCIGQKFFPGPFDVSVCASYANSQNKVNANWLAALWAKISGYNNSKCSFFNAYMVKQDGIAKGTYCNLFSQQFTPDKATYRPGWNGGKYYGVESSWSYCSK